MHIKNRQFGKNQGGIAKPSEVRRQKVPAKAMLHMLEGSTVNTVHCCVAKNTNRIGLNLLLLNHDKTVISKASRTRLSASVTG